MMEASTAHFFIDGPGIGSIKASDEERKKLALESRNFKCKDCGCLKKIENLIKKNN